MRSEGKQCIQASDNMKQSISCRTMTGTIEGKIKFKLKVTLSYSLEIVQWQLHTIISNTKLMIQVDRCSFNNYEQCTKLHAFLANIFKYLKYLMLFLPMVKNYMKSNITLKLQPHLEKYGRHHQQFIILQPYVNGHLR